MRSAPRAVTETRGRFIMVGSALPLTLLITLSAVSAPPAALSPGDAAPDFALNDRSGQTFRYDAKITSPSLFLSLKATDRYTSNEVTALEDLFVKFPQLKGGLNRWIVVSRMKMESDAGFLDGLGLKDWPVLLDPEDVFYKGYKIIATPTITIVGKDHKVVAVHPGYDPSMVQDVRLSLAKLLEVRLPAAVTQAPEKPNLTLQMARRMVKRGLWEKAVTYYEDTAKQGPLPPEDQLDLAEAYVEVRQPEKALEILKSIPAEQVDRRRLEGIRAQAERVGKAAEVSPTPPKIYR